jgi:signal transduction histidine kinase/CheY-like chemotaxis protein
MEPPVGLPLALRLGWSEDRRGAARELAAHLGVEAIIALVRDPELPVFLPAPGFEQTLPGGPLWRSFLAACLAQEDVRGQVGYPARDTPKPACALRLGSALFVFIGGEPKLSETERAALQVAGEVFARDHRAVIAEGKARAATEAAVHAGAVSRALEVTRHELHESLAESARLNDELRRTADREHEALAEAQAASRTKDEFLAMLGHELRNPLAPILTALQLMRQREPGAALRERTVIERQVGHLGRLVDDLLDVSRISRGKVELKKARFEIGEVVSKAIELASPLFDERHHHLTVQVPAQGLPVDGDPTRLAQIVSNLLTNAAKYTEPGGNIEVRAVRAGDQVVLTVRDNGTGIGASLLPRVFELFAQEQQDSDRSRGGLGLGLAIVKSLVEAHGGTVRAESEGRGLGSLFTVALPLASGEALQARIPAPHAPDQRSERRILVVDDNRDAAELLAELLREKGHTAEVALDGPTALDLAQHFHPDVAVLDLGLPVMDGYELARRLRERSPALRLIALTGYGQRSDRERTRAAGFDAHLVKPVAIDVLQSTVG